MNWLLVGTGFAVGFLVGLTGVGGGALISLILMFAFGLPARVVVGTSLSYAAITKMAATRVFQWYDLIDWTVAIIMWIGSVSGAILALIWINYMANNGQNISMWKQVIAGAILMAIMSLFLQPTIQNLSERRFLASGPGFTSVQITLTIVAGMMLGILVTLTSVGVGALGLIILTQLYPLRMTPPNIVATSLAHAIPLVFIGGVANMFLGNVDFTILWQLLLGSVPGTIFGALLAASMPHPSLRSVLSATLWIFGLQLWWSVLPSS